VIHRSTNTHHHLRLQPRWVAAAMVRLQRRRSGAINTQAINMHHHLCLQPRWVRRQWFDYSVAVLEPSTHKRSTCIIIFVFNRAGWRRRWFDYSVAVLEPSTHKRSTCVIGV
jgi:hypothetical protein